MHRRKKYLHFWLEFLWSLTMKEIKARYKKAVLGFLWIFLNPLLQMLIIGFIFQFFVPVRVDNYFLFLFIGLLSWNFFSYTVTKNTPMILNERGLIKKAKFPRETIILSIVLSNLFHTIVAWLLLVVLLIGDKIFSDHYTFWQLLNYGVRMLWTIPLLGWLTFLTAGISLLLSALNVKYRDVNFFVQAVMPLWFYATPIVYTLSLLPKELHIILYLNPLTGLMELFHATLLNLPYTNLAMIGFDFVLSVVIFIAGWVVFMREAPFFDDWI
jgi:lipopolysaccharide transport system permease protein